MSWHTELNSKAGIIETVFNGRVTAEELEAAASKVTALSRESGIEASFIDTTKMKRAPLGALFNLCAQQYPQEGRARTCRMAVLLSLEPEAQEAAQFYEMACTHSGWHVKLFTERQNALDWLLHKNCSGAPAAPSQR